MADHQPRYVSPGVRPVPLSRDAGRDSWRRRSRVALWAITGLVLGEAMLYHHSAPFAWLLLLFLWQNLRSDFAYALIGAVAGTGLAANWLAGLTLLALALAIPLPARSGWSWTRLPLVGFGAALMFWVAAPQTSWWTLAWTLAVGALTVVLYVLAVEEWGAMERREGDRRTFLLGTTALGAVVAGLGGLAVGGLNLALVAGGLLILFAAVAAGAPEAALGGAMLGMTLALRGETHGLFVGVLVAGGSMAGWVGARSWRLAPVGLIAGVTAYALLVRPPHPFVPLWLSLTVASVVWQAIPEGWVVRLTRLATGLMVGYDQTAVPVMLAGIGRVMEEVAAAFHVEDPEPSAESEVGEAVVDSVCRRCSMSRSCWDENFYRSYRGLTDLIARAEERPVTEMDVGGELGNRCIRPDELSAAVNAAEAKERERAGYRRRLRESRALAEVELRGVGRILSAMAADFRPEPVRIAARRPRIDLEVGVARRPRAGGTVSGDSYLAAELSRHRVAFALSDGMGVGPRAAWESGTATALLEQMLVAGFSAELAVHAVNTTLILRAAEEQFATLDLLVIDREGSTAEVVKVAAAPSFWIRDGRVEVYRRESLPVGIVDDIAVQPETRPVAPGDVVVLVTDGVLEEQGPGGEKRLQDLLARLDLEDAQLLADTILSYMLDQSGDGRDDAAVMVIKVVAANLARQVKRTLDDLAVGEWLRVTPGAARRA